ncbi:oncostatin-M isoform X1 [Felis catus]|uniref:oncostatin-M isoform X1 n=1 Tax=Felis catus TaxID=9685 RepID=UPI001D1A19C0|nr:oncostatin-M isoform X1 [Felis catus]
MFPEGLPLPPPSAPHPPHEVLANRPGGHKVAASPQGSQPGGVTPSRRRPELGHPACGHSLCGGRCSISIQGLDKDGLKEHCRERPGVFPSKDALQRLSRQEFLQILNTTLGHVLHRLRTLQKDIPKAQDLEKLNIAKLNIRGFKNNIHCMAQLLPGSLEKTEPTPTGPGASPSPTPISDAFQRRLEGCRFLHGYHRFMHSVGQVFREWGQSPSRSRRHSPRRGLRKGTHRTHLSSRNKRLMPRGWLPR